jgi:hypothetical protein
MGTNSIRTAKNDALPPEATRDPARVINEATRGLAAHLESGRLRIIDPPMGKELIAELNSFEVDLTSAGNMPVDVRSKDHRGDLVIATALALWSAVGRPSGRVTVGRARKLVSTPSRRALRPHGVRPRRPAAAL